MSGRSALGEYREPRQLSVVEADSEAAVAGGLQLIMTPCSWTASSLFTGVLEGTSLGAHHKHMLCAKNFSRCEGYSREKYRCKRAKSLSLCILHYSRERSIINKGINKIRNRSMVMSAMEENKANNRRIESVVGRIAMFRMESRRDSPRG